jgi:hypothetical protein
MISRRAFSIGVGAGVLSPRLALAAAAPAGPPFSAEVADISAAGIVIFRSGRYLAEWPRMVADLDPEGRDSFQQWAALLGDETTALADAARPRPAPDLGGARAEDALTAIVRAARGRRVVMLNEAHVASRHRGFLGRLVRALRAEGFTHLAAETFGNPGVKLATAPVESLRAGAALNPGQGYYINDPVYAEAVRDALALGYRLVAYEQRPDQMAAVETPQAGIPRREQAQAENLAAALKQWPEGRFLVHVGYGHLSKTPIEEIGPMMGGRFKALTGVDPLTIVQDSTGSFEPHARDSAATRAVLAKFQPKDSIVVFDANGEALYGRRLGCDLTVFHPALPDVEGRPGWLAATPGRRRVAVRLPTPAPVRAPGGYVLAQAVPAADPDPAIPADQYLLAAGVREAVFHLRPGRYRIRLETPEGFTAVGEATA